MWACICLYECWRLGGWTRSFLQLLNTCGSAFKYCTCVIDFSSAAFLGSCRLYKCRLYVGTNTADTQWFIWCHWIHTFQSLIIKINTITKKEWKQKWLLSEVLQCIFIYVMKYFKEITSQWNHWIGSIYPFTKIDLVSCTEKSIPVVLHENPYL